MRYVTAAHPLTRPPDYIVVDAITVDMIMASASIPLLFPPRARSTAAGCGTAACWSTRRSRRWSRWAPTRSSPSWSPSRPTWPPVAFPHFGRAVERTVDAILENAYNVDRKLLLDRNRLAHLESSPYREVTLYEAVRPARDGSFNAGSYLYFERGVLDAMRAAGQRAAKRVARGGTARRPPRSDGRWRGRLARRGSLP